MVEHRSFNVLGNVALVNFEDNYSQKEKKKFAEEILKNNKSVRTVLEKSGNFSGKLRLQKTRYLLGVKTKEVLYKENGCIFRFNVDKTYFSSRLANERKEVCSFVKPKDEVLCMFAGIAPFPIVIAKNTKVAKIYSNELNEQANDYARENIRKNKVSDKIDLVEGDVRKVCDKFEKEGKKFDLILMTRPNLDETFLDEAFKVSKNGTRIYYHSFCRIEEEQDQIKMIKEEAGKAGFNVKILNTKEIGDLGPGKVRFRIYFEIRKKGFLKRLFGRN